jgi:hypothetical protein
MQLLNKSSNNGPYMYWQSESQNPTYFRIGFGSSDFYSSNNTLMKISSEGRVAINTEDMPGDYHLHVNGNILGEDIVATGRVAINTEDMPGDYHLYVNGKILSEEMVVKLKGAWPDYVFNPDYDLLSLYELKDFIGKNKHLPGLPSAQQVADEGVDVGATQAAMLEKIEELTLYVIELQEQIDALEDRMKVEEK